MDSRRFCSRRLLRSLLDLLESSRTSWDPSCTSSHATLLPSTFGFSLHECVRENADLGVMQHQVLVRQDLGLRREGQEGRRRSNLRRNWFVSPLLFALHHLTTRHHTGDDSKGFFVQPTVIVTKDPKSITMVEEIFGPVITAFIYEDDKFEETCAVLDGTTEYALTGCLYVSSFRRLIAVLILRDQVRSRSFDRRQGW